jgi:SAM-dependent methyltransferase
LARYYPVGSLTGLDLSFGAIAFCHTNYAHADFYQGDAENLPFASRSFDVVTNVESSHNYPNPWRFYTEVQRILRPGGRFLYTDMLPMTNWERTRTQLQQLGFIRTHDRDITSNVLLSCDQTAASHQLIFPAENDAELMGSFLAVPGSNMYNAMQNGHSSYRILHLRRD